MWVCGSECVLCVGQFVVVLWERVCVVCGTVGVGLCVCGSECVGQFGLGLWE